VTQSDDLLSVRSAEMLTTVILPWNDQTTTARPRHCANARFTVAGTSLCRSDGRTWFVKGCGGTRSLSLFQCAKPTFARCKYCEVHRYIHIVRDNDEAGGLPFLPAATSGMRLEEAAHRHNAASKFFATSTQQWSTV
jgi:hypothetical protein